MLFVKSDRPIDPLTVAILRAVDGVAKTLQVKYFVAGAMARDFLLTNVFGLDSGRATRDIDFAIAVKSWAEFESIKEHLLNTGNFRDSDALANRLFYRSNPTAGGYPLDFIPFGGVESAARTVTWPPDGDTVLNVAGYGDVLEATVELQFAPELVIRVASLPGLVVLKLFAWADRGSADSKDALDLMTIFRRYAAAGNHDRLYNEAIGVLEAADYDLDLAGPRLLGDDVRRIIEPETMAQIFALLDDPKSTAGLVTDMARSLRGVEDAVDLAERLVAQFKAGINPT